MKRVHASGSLLAIALGALLAGPAASRTLDLEGVLNDAVHWNPSLAATHDRAEAARRRIAPAGAWAPPMLEAGVVNVPTSGRFDADPMTMKMLGLQQRVPVFGANGLARSAARSAWRSEQASALSLRLEIAGRVLEAYGDAYYASERLRRAAGHRDVMERMVAAARTRYASGRGRLEEVLMAEAESARMLVDLSAARAEQDQALARLEALRGSDFGAPVDSLVPPALHLAPDAADAWRDAIDPGLPRLAALQLEGERWRAAAASARRSIWPDLDLHVSYGLRSTLAGGMKQDNMFGATVGVALPVTAGAHQRSEAAEMDAMAGAAANELHAAAVDLKQELAGARAQARAAERTIALYSDTIVVAQQRALDAAWASYSAGAIDLARVLDSAHALYAEDIALTRARQDLAHACARVLTVTGRGELVGVTLPPAESGGGR